MLAVAIICSGYFASATPLSKRQSQASNLTEYTQKVGAAFYAAQIIEAGNETAVCNDPTSVADVDDEGYDGQYANMLMSVSPTSSVRCGVANGNI